MTGQEIINLIHENNKHDVPFFIHDGFDIRPITPDLFDLDISDRVDIDVFDENT